MAGQAREGTAVTGGGLGRGAGSDAAGNASGGPRGVPGRLGLAFLLGLLCIPLGAWGQEPAGGTTLPAGAAGAAGAEPRILTLDQALLLAMDGNRDLRLARLALVEAEGMVSEAWGNVYPSVDFNTTYTRNLSPSVSFLPAIIFDPSAEEGDLVRVQFGAENVWSGSVSVEQPLFQAQAFIGVGAAGRFQALQEEGVRGQVHEVMTRVRILYYDLLLAQEQARLIERSVERVVQSLEETRALNRAGLASDYDVLRLEVELANLEPQLRRAANEARRMEREMVTELDLPAGTTIRPVGSLAQLRVDDPDANDPENARLIRFHGVSLPAEVSDAVVEELFLRAHGENSAIQQAGLNAELRRAELQFERAEYLPRISLFGGYDIQAQHDGRPDFFGASGQRGYGRNVGVRVTIPLFTGFQRGARVEQRQASYRSAELERDVAADRLRDELRTLLEQADESRLRARSQGLAVEQAQRGYEIASAQYREGIGSQLELTDAEVALRQSEFNYAEAVFDYLSSRARLDRAVGVVPVPGSEL